MNTHKQISIAWYAVMDYVMAALAWLLFYIIRSAMANDSGSYPDQLSRLGIYFSVVPAGWLMLYALAGTYTLFIKNQDWLNLRYIYLQHFWQYCLLFVFVLDDAHTILLIILSHSSFY